MAGLINAMLHPRRRTVKSMAMAGAATWAMNRVARRSPRAGRVLSTASWALPLGMMAWDRVRTRRDMAHDGLD
ncbi:MAG TPA: hypothetical protein VFR37_22130 [Longimicrobium sp.]|nr:hypothetical protein [Longimicrobium sp.]